MCNNFYSLRSVSTLYIITSSPTFRVPAFRPPKCKKKKFEAAEWLYTLFDFSGSIPMNGIFVQLSVSVKRKLFN